MALETASYINGLVATNPTATDTVAQADDHIRLIKAAIKATLPNITGAMTASHTELNTLDGITATTAELNKLDGFTGSVSDLNYAAALNATGVTATEFDYLDGVTSNIQAQISGISTELVNDTTPQLGGQLDTNGQSIAFGNWTISIDGSNNLSFAYAGDVKLRITAAGALDVEDDITAFSGI
jgi:hypothetical protein